MKTQITTGAIREQLVRHGRDENLTAMTGRHEAGRTVDDDTEIVVAPSLGKPCVHTDANPDDDTGGPGLSGQRALYGHCGVGRIVGSVERGVERVSAEREDDPPVGLDLVAKDLVVPSEGGLHLPGVSFPQPRRPLDIGEKEVDQSGRPLGHGEASLAGSATGCQRL